MAQENGMCKYGESSCHLSRGITKQVNLWNHKQNSVLQKNQFSDGKIACCFLKPTLPPRGNHQGFLRRSSKPKSMKAPEGSKPWGSSPPEREHQGTMSEKPSKNHQQSWISMDIHGSPIFSVVRSAFRLWHCDFWGHESFHPRFGGTTSDENCASVCQDGIWKSEPSYSRKETCGLSVYHGFSSWFLIMVQSHELGTDVHSPLIFPFKSAF